MEEYHVASVRRERPQVSTSTGVKHLETMHSTGQVYGLFCKSVVQALQALPQA